MAQSQTSKPVDPLQGKSIFSLHPRRFRDSNASLKSNDIEAIHQHMNSMALQDHDKRFEEAKAIIEGGSELLDAKENFEPKMKENENPRKNRPALARKRAKFSMKPDTSQPSTVVEPTFKMDQLLDPDDFFAAYEKFEKAKKELKRLRGEDPNEPVIPTTARQRRPEIPRRKRSYQHHVYSSSSQPENDTLFSQETLPDTTESQPIQDIQQSVTPNRQSNGKEVARSITNAEDRVNKIFDDLMSSNIADLDDNEAMSLLKDRLNIKRVAINDLHLPDFHNISVNLLKDQNKLPDTRALSDNLKENTIEKQKKLPDKPFNHLSSPTPSKSPLMAISAFGKYISKSIEAESIDPFKPLDIDLFPATTTSETISGPSTHASKDTEVPVFASEDDLSDREQHNMKEIDVDMQKNAEDMVEKGASSTKHNLNVEDITDNIHCEQETEENVEDATEKLMSSIPPDENVETITIGESENNFINSAQTDDSSINIPISTLPVQNPDVPEQPKEHPKKAVNNRKWTKETCKFDPKKKRNSLADAGSRWTSGVRRSNRMKSKPMEYWRGERLLYARFHSGSGLPTVVGRKCKDGKGKPGFKVEYFVSDERKDLVDLIALH